MLDKVVADGESQCSQLDYSMPLDKAGAQIAAVSNVLQSINSCESSYTNLVELRADLLQRAAALQSRHAAFASEFNKIIDGLAGLRAARTIDQFSAATKLLASSEFSSSPPVKSAAAIRTMDTSPETTLRLLLGMTNESTWAYLQKTSAPRFVPEIVMPAEKTILNSLNADPAVSGVHAHYRLWLDAQGSRTLEWITSGLLEETEGWTKIIAWSPYVGAATASFTEQRYGYFNHQYKLSPTQDVYRAEMAGTLDETASFDNIGLDAVRVGNNYQKPILEVLDALKDSKAGSPLFRAYLFLRLTDVMNLQPNAWGLSFCPAVRVHAAQLRATVGNNLQTGDWFITDKARKYNAPLAQLFSNFAKISYVKQASGLFALSEAMSNAGLTYAGYVGLDGHPSTFDEHSSHDLWALSGDNGQPRPVAAAASPILLLPVFSLGQAPNQILSNAAVTATDPCFAGVLPPLFRN
jgi:hypothetical protein